VSGPALRPGLRPEPRPGLRRALGGAVVPLAAVAVAALVGAAVMALAGIDPLGGYGALVRGALGPGDLDFTAAAFTAILAMAVVFAVPHRMGEYNLGGDGQLVAGGITAAAVGLSLPAPAAVLLPACLLAAALAGAAVAAASAPLANRLGVPVVISTLLLAVPVTALASYLVRFPLAQPGSGVAQTPRLPDAAHLPALSGLRYTNLGLLLVLLVLVAFVVVDARTSVGFELRVTGANRAFADYGGVPVARLTLGALAVSGAVGGLAGAVIVMSQPFRFIDDALTAPGYTFAGIAAALLAGGRPVLLPLTAGLFTVLQVGAAALEREADVPRQLGQVLQAVVILVLALRTVVRWRATRAAAP
jgi:simple sugar transport system permease protein